MDLCVDISSHGLVSTGPVLAIENEKRKVGLVPYSVSTYVLIGTIRIESLSSVGLEHDY